MISKRDFDPRYIIFKIPLIVVVWWAVVEEIAIVDVEVGVREVVVEVPTVEDDKDRATLCMSDFKS